MQDASWDQWVEHHTLLFGLTREDETRMVLEWAGLFAAAGMTVEEAWEASDWLALNPPAFRNLHVLCLQQRLFQQRRQKALRPPDEVPEEVCGECEGTGLVSVPNPKAERLGWGWTTMAVACPCRAGRAMQEQSGFLSLREYERGWPDWRAKMRAHADYLKRTVQVTSMTREMDRLLGAIRGRRKAAGATHAPQKAEVN